MSNISLQGYINKALQSEDGTIRVDSKESGTLVNKGTFGNKVATFLGMGTVQTRDDREKQALNGFREAMEDTFGKEITDQAYYELELQGMTTLKGSNVLDITTRAKELSQQVRTNNVVQLQGLKDRIEENNQLTPEQKTEVLDRMISDLSAKTDAGRHGITDEEAGEIMRTALDEVDKLGNDRLLEGKTARENLWKAIANVYVSLANGKDPDHLLERMTLVETRLKELESIEEPGGFSPEKRQEKLRQGMYTAFSELKTTQPGFSLDAQKKALNDSSSLRALYSGARQIFTREDSTSLEKQSAKRLMDLGELLLGDMSPKHGLHKTDMRQLQDGTTVKSRVVESGREALTQMREKPDLGRTGITQMLAPYQGEGRPYYNWHDRRVLIELEETFNAFQTQRGGSVSRNVEDMQEAIRNAPEGDDGIHPLLKDKMIAALDAIKSGQSFIDMIRQHEEFDGIQPEDMWRLCGTGRGQEGVTKWDLEHSGLGSLDGAQRAFERMLGARDEGVPLTLEHLEELHGLVSRNGNAFNDAFDDLYKPTTQRQMDDESKVMLREGARTVPGVRLPDPNNSPPGLALKDWQTTEKGLEHLKELGGSQFVGLIEEKESQGVKSVVVNFKHDDDGAMRGQMNSILRDYRDAMQILMTENGSEDDKLKVIARTVQDLYLMHPFKDGNARTLVVLAMNRMLLDVGLTPSVLDDPKRVVGTTVEELIEDIRQGQQNFLDLKQQPNEQQV